MNLAAILLGAGLAAAPLFAPATAWAQSAIYTGNLHCDASADGAVPAGNDGMTINSRNYRATYTHLMVSTGPAFVGLPDFGRGNLVGNTLTMTGGGSQRGVTLSTSMTATNTGRTYQVTATQTFSGKGFPVPVTRACRGLARLVIG
jgi:hypothetical protein